MEPKSKSNSRLIQVDEMFARAIGDDRIKDIESFKKLYIGARNFDLKWEQNIAYYSFAKKIAELFRGTLRYVQFHERGIWPSSENRYLFSALCDYCLGNGKFTFGDALEVAKHDDETLISFLQLALQFGWGGVILCDSRHWFYFSHDSWGCLGSPDDVATTFQSLHGVQIARPPGYPGLGLGS
ncbi:hypothetical protein [Methylocapsa sp. S129]|uniref:hypothetical protein n=1 Tax=Methylocapsa sp. S129 TaxID=1641869 RepID=UPI00131D8A6D|nr:hypothetical protein [Methylocapsa sp. S129]